MRAEASTRRAAWVQAGATGGHSFGLELLFSRVRHGEVNRRFSDAVAAIVDGLPPAVDTVAPRAEVGVLGRQLRHLFSLHEEIVAQQKEDIRRVGEISEQPALTEQERREGADCVQRLLEGERAKDALRVWWNDNMPAISTLMKRAGGEELAALIAEAPQPSPENLELRAWLRRAGESLRSTKRARLKRRIARPLTAPLKSTGRALEDWANRHLDNKS